jgi:hypothetical protein
MKQLEVSSDEGSLIEKGHFGSLFELSLEALNKRS